MRKFNVTTTCVPHLHYMVDIEDKFNRINDMIEEGLYFTINRGRQKGKTTILKSIGRLLNDKYLVIPASFEGKSYLFNDSETFASNIFNVFAEPFEIFQPEIAEKIKSYAENLKTIDDVSRAISKWSMESDKEILLLIDEVDKASNYYVFMDFLGMLRKKYIARQSKEDITFKSIILAGVSDIKRIKVHIDERRILSDKEAENLVKSEYNSPWNVAADFSVVLDFNEKEIETMLFDYLSEHDEVNMDIGLISRLLFKYTSGYPYLVSKLCKIIDEKLDKDFSENGIEEAVKILLNEKNTLFDDLIKNVVNIKELYSIVYPLIMDNENISYNVDAHEIGIMYSILKNDENNNLKVHNKIFEIRLYNYFIAQNKKEDLGLKLSDYTARGLYENNDGSLDIESALLKYQEYMKSVYNKYDKDFIERQGRLLLLAFFKPIINGHGFYFVESQTGFEQRQDIVITFNNNKYIIELKIWRGENHHNQGLNQLKGYMELENADKGYLVIYDKNKNKEYKDETAKLNGIEIFSVWV